MNKDNELQLRELFSNWSFRSVSPNLSTFKKEGKTATVRAVITTENPAMIVDYEKSDFWNWDIKYAREILLMEGMKVHESKQVPLLNVHSRWRTSDVRGSIRNIVTENSDAVGDVHFWSKAEDEISQVEEGHLTDLSAGYRVSEKETVKLNPGEKVEINGRTFENNFGDECRLFIRKYWELKEGSLVPIGADSGAKFRSELLSTEINPPKIRADDPELQKVIDEAVEKKLQIKLKQKGDTQMKETTDELTVEQRAEIEVSRQIEIREAAELYGKQYKHGDIKLKEAVALAIKEKHSVDVFKSHLLDNFDSSKALQTPGVDLSENQKREYSISAAIIDTLEGKFGGKRSGLVKEVSDELEKQFGDKKGTNAFLVPNEFFGAKTLFDKNVLGMLQGKSAIGVEEMKMMLRAITATGGGSGGTNIVGDSFRPDLFVQVLRENLALGAAGVTILTGLTENLTIPRQLTDSTYALTTEGVAAGESALTFDQLTSAPNPASGWVEFTKQLLIQGNPSIDALVRDSLMAQAMRGKDYYGLVGGTGITGLLNESGTYPVTIAGDPSWDEIVEFETGIENANANIGDLKWLMSPTVKGRAKTIPKLSGSQFSGWLMETNGEMNGYQSVISTILNRDPMDGYYLILGVWKQMMLNLWGATEVQVNPFSKDTQGIIRIVLLDHFDWIVRQPAAFAIADDVTES